jgi:hypothetical protein
MFICCDSIIGFAVADQNSDAPSFADIVEVAFEQLIDGVKYGLFIGDGMRRFLRGERRG